MDQLLSDELVRRTVCGRLDAGDSRPHLRAGFKHADLLGWVRGHRSEVVGSVLTLVRAWLAAGRPAGEVRLGMFESWGRMVGGILGVAGIEGLRQSVEHFQRAPTDTEQTLKPFLVAW
jgi:hypothetical protein